jgi:endonuclease/exonuclease/phosphatase family metal-dependent hydrolase
MLKSESQFRIDGNGVLIKNDIEILEEHRLVYKNLLRVAQILKLQKQGQTFIFVNTHLDHLSELIREEQLLELLNVLKNYANYPIICTGDYNFLPEVDNYKLMSNEFKSVHFQVHGKEPQITFPTGLFGPYADIESYGCFDYIWFRGGKAISGEVFRDCGNQQVWASDHYPVYGEIEFI